MGHTLAAPAREIDNEALTFLLDWAPAGETWTSSGFVTCTKTFPKQRQWRFREVPVFNPEKSVLLDLYVSVLYRFRFVLCLSFKRIKKVKD